MLWHPPPPKKSRCQYIYIYLMLLYSDDIVWSLLISSREIYPLSSFRLESDNTLFSWLYYYRNSDSDSLYPDNYLVFYFCDVSLCSPVHRARNNYVVGWKVAGTLGIVKISNFQTIEVYELVIFLKQITKAINKIIIWTKT